MCCLLYRFGKGFKSQKNAIGTKKYFSLIVIRSSSRVIITYFNYDNTSLCLCVKQNVVKISVLPKY